MAHFRETPGHGYYYLSAGELAAIPEFARRHDYEEDCEWSIPVVALPRLAEQTKVFGPDPAKTLRDAHEMCCNAYPDIYEMLTGAICTPENSHKRAEEQFYRDNKDRYIGISASGDWKEGVPKGYVEVLATIGGERDWKKAVMFYIREEDYHCRGSWGYVIPETQKPVVDKAICKHPPERLYSWSADDGTLCVGCCACGTVLKGAAE